MYPQTMPTQPPSLYALPADRLHRARHQAANRCTVAELRGHGTAARQWRRVLAALDRRLGRVA